MAARNSRLTIYTITLNRITEKSWKW